MSAVILLATIAHATIDFEVCIQMDILYPENISDPPRVYVLDDYLANNAVNEPIRGIWITVAQTQSPWTLTQGFADESGTNAGCLTVTVDPASQYMVTAFTQALVNGQTISLYDELADPDMGIWTAASAWQPLYLGQGLPKKTWAHPWNAGWGNFTAVVWAFYHRDGGLPDQSWDVYWEACPGLADPCYSVAEDAIFLPNDNKVQPAHNVAHAIAYRKHGGVGASYDAIDDDCWYASPLTHELQSREFAAAAYQEGFAQFYTAVTYNSKTDTDCFLPYYKNQDYDLDGDEEPRTTNCQGVPWRDAAGNPLDAADPDDNTELLISVADYLHDSHNELSPGCSSLLLTNRATELDYFRFLWEMYNVEGMSVAEVLDIATLSDPSIWDGGEDPETGSFLFYPYYRLLTGAAAYDGGSYLTAWTDRADRNGVLR